MADPSANLTAAAAAAAVVAEQPVPVSSPTMPPTTAAPQQPVEAPVVDHTAGPRPEEFVAIKGKPVMGVGFGNVLKEMKPRRVSEDT